MSSPSIGVVMIDFVHGLTDEDSPYFFVCGDQVSRHEVWKNTTAVCSAARELEYPVIWLSLGFQQGYVDLPEGSMLFGEIPDSGLFVAGSRSSSIDRRFGYISDDLVVVKNSVSSFFGTGLYETLKLMGIHELVVGGVTTDLGVLSFSRECHDRSLSTTVLSDCCAAADQAVHHSALEFIRRTSCVRRSAELHDVFLGRLEA